ncbi:hypothetical protein AtDm6_3056 [Acetobacter tropicalis]|uniref:Uncharacterized protein n=1 Tax=Acetobacter tropicalis TaxID=104102 RepID=A0A094YHA6_9PROT|nr:hypothetical protein AtDm6_3056 [Acetobacter tropicalis]
MVINHIIAGLCKIIQIKLGPIAKEAGGRTVSSHVFQVPSSASLMR